jgi:hypothetical protein
MTRLSFLSSSTTTLHSRIIQTSRHISTIRRSIPHTGLTTLFAMSPVVSQPNGGPSRSKVTTTKMKPQTRGLSRELEDGIQPWTGPSVFSTTPSSPLTSSPSRRQERWKGTSSSPINISSAESSPIIVNRVRGVPSFKSPLPRTAYTSPSKPPNMAPGQTHPFFNRTKSLPPPASNRPRLVAHYSSTESSQQTEGDSQSTFGGPSQSPTKSVRMVGAPPDAQAGKQSVKGKEKARIPDNNEFSDEAIDAMASEFANVKIGRKPGLPFGLKVSPPTNDDKESTKAGPSNSDSKAPTTTSLKPSSKSKPKKPIEPEDPDTEYFQYQKTPKPPSVVYTTDPDEANDLISCLKGDVFGFDLEWPSNVKTWDKVEKKVKFGQQGKTALVQICDHHTIILIHLRGKTRMFSCVSVGWS